MDTFEEIAMPHYQYFLAVARKMCYGNTSDAEDIVQETYLKAYEKFNTYDKDKSSITTWMHRILLNTRVSALRHQARHASQPILDNDVPYDSISIDGQVILHIIDKTLAEFDDVENLIFEKSMDRLDTCEISKEINMPQRTVSHKLSRMRERLKHHLSECINYS